MVSSSYGLSNFKLRGVFFVVASVSSAVPLEQKNIQNSSQTNKQKQKKKWRIERVADGLPERARRKSCASPRGLLRHSPRLSSWVQRGQAGPQPDASGSAEVKRVLYNESRAAERRHTSYSVSSKWGERKKELGKGAARWNNCKKKRALVDEGLPLYTPSLPLFTWIPWCWLPGK